MDCLRHYCVTKTAPLQWSGVDYRPYLATNYETLELNNSHTVA
jgi:hypothetical protein